MINRSESQLIAREARNQVLKANRRNAAKPARRPKAETADASNAPDRKPDQK